jgi:hypothetical protein
MEEHLASVFSHFRELELFVAMLAVKFGDEHEGGYRITIPAGQAWLLRQHITSMEPVVILHFQADKSQYVVDVL